MRILIWHVHGSWTTSFVQGPHEYLLPVTPDRGPDGRGRALTWDWPASAREITYAELADARPDLVVLQRPHEADLLRGASGLRAGSDLPALYLEHDAPTAAAATSRHPLADRADVPVVHVTRFNAVMWDCGRAPTEVVEHGIPDPGHLYTGEDDSLAVVVNEPVRRGRIAGTDLVLAMSERVPLDVYGMGMDALARSAPRLAPRLHENPRQSELHRRLAGHRAYFHPYRWTSLGLALLEAMTIGLPVLALSTTEAPRAVPPEAGLLSNDLDALTARARHWLADPAEAAATGTHARAAALDRYGLDRFLTDWDRLIEKVMP